MTVELLTFGCRLNAYESEVMRALTSRAADGTATSADPATRSPTPSSSTPAPSPPRPNARPARPSAVPPGNAPTRASSSPAAPHNSTPLRGPRCPTSSACWATRTSCGRKAGCRTRPRRCPTSWRRATPRPHLVTEFAGRARAFVQVQQGCDHRCTFCIIPFGRGPSRSVPVGAVVAQVRALVEAGYQEVVLTGVDIASLRARPAGRARAWPACAPAAGTGAGTASAAAVLARPGGDRRRSVARAGRANRA